jgi:hypothetical protein
MDGETVSVSTTFGGDNARGQIQNALDSDPTLRAKLSAWLETNAPNTRLAVFLNASEYAVLRVRAVKELGLDR